MFAGVVLYVEVDTLDAVRLKAVQATLDYYAITAEFDHDLDADFRSIIDRRNYLLAERLEHDPVRTCR